MRIPRRLVTTVVMTVSWRFGSFRRAIREGGVRMGHLVSRKRATVSQFEGEVSKRSIARFRCLP